MKRPPHFTLIVLVALAVLTLGTEARDSGNSVCWGGGEDYRGQEGPECQRRAAQGDSFQQQDETGLERINAPVPFQGCGIRPDYPVRAERIGAADYTDNTVTLYELLEVHRQWRTPHPILPTLSSTSLIRGKPSPI